VGKKSGVAFRFGLHRKRLVLHAHELDLNREFRKRGSADWHWFFAALSVFIAIDYVCLRMHLMAPL